MAFATVDMGIFTIDFVNFVNLNLGLDKGHSMGPLDPGDQTILNVW